MNLCARALCAKDLTIWLGLLILIQTGGVSAQVPLGGEFQVETFTVGEQRSSAVAADDLGRFIVVWSSEDVDGDDNGVQGQRFNSLGQRIGGEFRINSFTRDAQGGADVAMHDDGRFVVAWTSLGPPDDLVGGVRAQRFDSAGRVVGDEFRVNTYTTEFQVSADVAMDGAGGFVVVWRSEGQDGSETGIHAQRFDASGIALGGEFQVNTYTTDRQEAPALAIQPDGRFVVVWTSYLQDGTYSSVFGQRFDSAGQAAGGEFQVNTSQLGYQRRADVAGLGAGGFVVVFASWDLSESFIFGQVYDSAGAPSGGEFQINTSTTGFTSYPEVAAHPDGPFVVTWSDFRSNDEQYVLIQSYDVSAQALGGEFAINASTTRTQRGPDLALDSAGRFVVTWNNRNEGAFETGIHGQLSCLPINLIGLDLGGPCLFADGFESGDLAAWSSR